MRGSNSNENSEGNASLQSELESLLLQQQRNRSLALDRDRDRDLDINRSGSAPPTFEGALGSVGNLFGHPSFAQVYGGGSSGNTISNLAALTEEEIRSHPAYLEYYYSHENINPRLPPPMLSKEDWRVAQRVRAAGLGSGINLVDSGGNSSLFSMQPGLAVKKAEEEMIELRKAALRNISRKNSAESLDKCATGSSGASSSGMGARRKSFADILQEGVRQPAKSQLSRAASQNSVADILDSMVLSNSNAVDLRNKAETIQALLAEKTLIGLSSNQNIGSVLNSSFTSSSPSLVTLGDKVHLADNINSDARNFPAPSIFEIADIAASLSGVNMLRGQLSTENISKPSLQVPPGFKPSPQQQLGDNSRAENVAKNVNYINLARNSGSTIGLNVSQPITNERESFPRSSSTSNLQSQRNLFDYATLEDLKPDMMINSDIGPVPLGTLLAAASAEGQLLRSSNPMGLHIPVLDLHQLQYLQKLLDLNYIAGNPSRGLRSVGSVRSYEDLQVLERAYLEALLLQQVQQYQSLLLQKPAPTFGPSADTSQGNVTPKPQIPRVGSRNSMLQNERSAQTVKTKKDEPSSSLPPQSGNTTKGRFESLLEVVKNNKAKSLELLDILGHVVEFSTDQFGSRFIQQKLETATDEEKTKVLVEIIPHARALMIDVFGNYVIQKFFEHGTESHRKELATHLMGHVLPLTLQMYGCRVIQKALEVVDVEMQAEMVAELDGSVMKCIHDQNGNHVIQKCIECVPQDRIQFIIKSFLGQVVTLSTHPYGCRVIQRVLEHCDDLKTQESIMEEIMGSVCKLAQDQYGNYVIQYVVQHGKPHERSEIISKLAGQIVKMSQQKFASNVVEKCLTYGGPDERKLLVNEMLGSTDENEPLQAMMKDPFGNYVVQKVLETCDNKSRELILSRIKVHLNALKKYTYGKHIVSRVEKLVATGEKHTGQSSSDSP